MECAGQDLYYLENEYCDRSFFLLLESLLNDLGFCKHVQCCGNKIVIVFISGQVKPSYPSAY